MSQRMKQRIERLEDQQGTTESPIDCVILVPIPDAEQTGKPLSALSGYGVTVQRETGEVDSDFEQRAKLEMRKALPTGVLIMAAKY